MCIDEPYSDMVDKQMVTTAVSPDALSAQKNRVQEIIGQIVPSMILAPSAHNTQPWKFAPTADGAITIFIDWERHLRIADPTHRQLYTSLGCAIENAIIAGRYWGYQPRLDIFPNGEGKESPIARLHFTPDHEEANAALITAKLFAAIEQRRTDRSLYTNQLLSTDERQALTSQKTPDVVLLEDRTKIAAIAKLTEEGTVITLSRADFKNELSQWVRNNWTFQSDGMPGYAMGMPAPISLLASVMVRLTPIHKQEGPKTRQQIENSAAIAVIVTPADKPADWLAAGQLLEQLWLQATSAGLAAAPLAAAIEANSNIRDRLRKVLNTSLWPQAILRIGHSQKPHLKATPRRTIEDCLR